ncbi:MAG: hypothetical protein ACI9MR_002480 [Myxococcota bacterium]|jgi:hypothetical protein
MNLLTVGIYGGMLFVVRNTLMTTKVNRAGMALLGSGQLCAAAIWAMGDVAGLDVLTTVSFSLILYPMTMIALGLVLDPKVAWAALFVTPLCILAPAYPEYAFEAASVAGFVSGMWGAFIWRRQRRTPDSTRTSGP